MNNDKLDKYYLDMIYNIDNGASDREQLLIIKELITRLIDWQGLYISDNSVEDLYYNNLNKMLEIAKDTLSEEKRRNMKEYFDKNNIPYYDIELGKKRP